MSWDLDFIEDLQDFGLLSNEVSPHTFQFNDDLIGKEHLALRNKLPSYLCSVNQSRLAEWRWLIGNVGGALHPMLCVTRRRYNCTSENPFFYESDSYFYKLIAIACVLCLLHLINLAVWCRVKTPQPVKREPPIQLLILRLFSAIDLAGTIAPVFIFSWLLRNNVRIFSVLHAVLVAQFINFINLMPQLCLKLMLLINFLTSVYLVEYSHLAQQVIVFTNLRRAKIILGIAAIISAMLTLPMLFGLGFLYCLSGSNSYLIHNYYYSRYSHGLTTGYWVTLIFIFAIIVMLNFILLIVYASKRCCKCCRCSSSTNFSPGFLTVTYVRQMDEGDGENDCPREVTIADIEAEVPSEFGLAFELRKLIFWQQVALYLILILTLIAVLMERLTRNPGSAFNETKYKIFNWTQRVLQYLVMSRLTILSPFLSPAYRAAYRAMFVELRDFAVERVRRLRK